MKIYSFDGKKKIADNIDVYQSPLFLGQKFNQKNASDISKNEITNEKEKPIEKNRKSVYNIDY